MEVTKESFLKNVKAHKMHVLKDDGVYRHVKFKNPETGNRWFEIVTWPNCLCIGGDMGNYGI